jgi:hypothetical protein
MVINTMGWVEGLGYELQLHAITTLKVSCSNAVCQVVTDQCGCFCYQKQTALAGLSPANQHHMTPSLL